MPERGINRVFRTDVIKFAETGNGSGGRGEDMDFAMPERELFQEFYCYGFVVPHVPA